MITLDTSAVLALYDADDPHHGPVTSTLRAERPPMLLPAATMGELGYLLEVRLGTAAAIDLAHDLAGGAFVLDCGVADFPRIAALLDRYADLRLGFTDAAVIACAERNRGRVLTLDFRDFAPVAREGRIELALTA